jgi:hypothetical protein
LERRVIYKIGNRTVRKTLVERMAADGLIIQNSDDLFGGFSQTYRLATGDELRRA